MRNYILHIDNTHLHEEKLDIVFFVR